MSKPILTVVISILLAFSVAFSGSVHAATKEVTKKRSVKKAVSAKVAPAKKKATAANKRASNTSRSKSALKTVLLSNKSIDDVAVHSREKTVRKVLVKNGKRRVIYQRVPMQLVPVVPPVLTAGDIVGLHLTRDPLELSSNVALVVDQASSQVLFEKNPNVALPIASITKLMTGLVVVEALQDMDEMLEVTEEDVDREKYSGSRLRVGSRLSRANMLHIALMSSENRAASALGRHYPGGLPGFVTAMNMKAKSLGMVNARFVDATGLSSQNVASAQDLVKLVMASYRHPVLGQYSTDQRYAVNPGRHVVEYSNSNRLVTSPDWEIGLQKTGYISEAGRCLVMQARIDGRPVVMVFLDSKGKFSRLADASRVRKWLSTSRQPTITDVELIAKTPKV